MKKFKVISKQNNSSDCIVCGIKNKSGLQSRFYVLENNKLASIVKFKSIHQSYPGRVHGGMIASFLDEILGRALQIYNPDDWGVTVDLQVKYKKPVPYDEELISVGWVNLPIKRLFTGESYIATKDGVILATATATYLKLPAQDISQNALNHRNWFYIEEEIPEYFELPED